MGDEHFHTTLAYTKSPKASRRTTFQEELKSAISARASRHKPADSNAYLDDFEDDEDDILNELLKTRKKKIDMFKTGRTKAKINDFQLSDEEEENVRPKKVSFMKTKRKGSPVRDALTDSRKTDTISGAESTGSFTSYRGSNSPQSTQEPLTPEKEQQDALFASQTESQAAWKNQLESTLGRKNQSESSMSRKNLSESSTSRKNQSESSLMRKNLSESPLPLNSENSQGENSLHLPLEGSWSECGRNVEGIVESPVPQPRERSTRQISQRDSCEEKPPRPVPRQRAPHAGSSGRDEADGLAETLFDKAALSSSSVTLPPSERATTTSAFSETAWASGSDYVRCEEEHTVFPETSMYSSPALQQGSGASNSSLQGPVDGSGSEQDKKEHGPMPFKEYQEGCFDTPHVTASRQHEITFNSHDRSPSSRPVSSRKSKSPSYHAESRYLGTLKVLDQKTLLEGTQPTAIDSLRAAAYQDWLRKKQEKLQETLTLKKQEEKLIQEKKTEEATSKKVEAKASYEAWREKKHATLRVKVKEKQEALRKQQKEADEKEDKKDTAKKVFEKWKREHDSILRERLRTQAQEEARLREKKELEQEKRKRECKSSFSQWNERKKDSILEKTRVERRKQLDKEVEENYEKEEREKTALESYEKWLRRKDFLQKRERQEKKIKAIVQEEAPPPWSPPGKTIPFGKYKHLLADIAT